MTIEAARMQPEAEAAMTAASGPMRRAFRRLLRKRIAVVALTLITLFYVCGVSAPWTAPYDYTDQNLENVFAGPSWEHPFGTDRLGRDMLSRSMWAARTTTIVTLATVLTGGFLLPITLGMLAGYRRGFVDAAIMRVGEILSSLPGLPMLILINATMRPRIEDWVASAEDSIGWRPFGGPHPISDSIFLDYFIIFFALSLFGWVGSARLIRAQVLTLRGQEFVLAAEAAGATTSRVIFRHLLPNIMPLIIVGMSASLGAIAGSEVALTFLGVGVQPPGASFGALITEGASRTVLENHPQLLLVPAVAIATLIFSFNLLGDAMTDIVTPRSR